MIFLILTLLLFSQFQCALSNEKTNAELFNEFIKVIFDMNAAEPSENAAVKMALTLVDSAKILEIVEKNVAEPILAPSAEIRQIKEGFTKTLTELKQHFPGEKMQNIVKKITAKFTWQMEQVQFLMLLLSFATKLAFTIGSEPLEKHKIAMGSFVRAFKLLNDNFPADEYKRTWKETGKLLVLTTLAPMGGTVRGSIRPKKLRYYRDAILKLDKGTANVLFIPANEQYYENQIFNFATIYYYLEAWRWRHEFGHSLMNQKGYKRAGHLIRLLKGISDRKPLEKWVDPDGEFSFFDRLMRTWSTAHYPQGWVGYELDIPRFVALKNFGANLAKLMLRKKPREYFEGNENQLEKFEEALKGLIGKFEKDVAEHQNIADNFYNEQLLHYEDAVQIDWTNKQEFSLMTDKIKKQFAEWNELVTKCRFENNLFIDCEFDGERIKEEFEKIKTPYFSFKTDGFYSISVWVLRLKDLEKGAKNFNHFHGEKRKLEEKNCAEPSPSNCGSGLTSMGVSKEKIKQREDKLHGLLQLQEGVKKELQAGINKMHEEVNALLDEFNF